MVTTTFAVLHICGSKFKPHLPWPTYLKEYKNNKNKVANQHTDFGDEVESQPITSLK